MSANQLYIGLMSGTSVDAIDCALVDFASEQPQLLASYRAPYQQSLRNKILRLCENLETIDSMAQVNSELGLAFAQAVNELLQKERLRARQITAIGSHGQTIRHAPKATHPFTLQIADPSTIAEQTGITTIADFRAKDVAAGGQGAPFAPAFHREVFKSNYVDRVILNIGGIANVTLIPKDNNCPVSGFDTGPGNGLLDAWIMEKQNQAYDHSGAWAKTGSVDNTLLTKLLQEEYFQQCPPKSTGRELFNLHWLKTQLVGLQANIRDNDVQATLVELSAQSIKNHIQHYCATASEVYVCGGGVHNDVLMQRIQELLGESKYSVHRSNKLGIEADWVEAMAFAWLAKQTYEGKAVDLRSITGAKHPCILGGIYRA